MNFVWLKPVAKYFPTSVPGGTIMTDVFLLLNLLMKDQTSFVCVCLMYYSKAITAVLGIPCHDTCQGIWTDG